MATELTRGPGREAARHASLALLRTLGGEKAWLQTAQAMTSNATTGLGMTSAVAQELLLDPALLRSTQTGEKEVVVEAGTLRDALQLMNGERVEDHVALGTRLRVRQSYYRIVRITPEERDGDAYIYRLGVEG